MHNHFLPLKLVHSTLNSNLLFCFKLVTRPSANQTCACGRGLFSFYCLLVFLLQILHPPCLRTEKKDVAQGWGHFSLLNQVGVCNSPIGIKLLFLSGACWWILSTASTLSLRIIHILASTRGEYKLLHCHPYKNPVTFTTIVTPSTIFSKYNWKRARGSRFWQASFSGSQ